MVKPMKSFTKYSSATYGVKYRKNTAHFRCCFQYFQMYHGKRFLGTKQNSMHT